jgi:acyl carrier protein
MEELVATDDTRSGSGAHRDSRPAPQITSIEDIVAAVHAEVARYVVGKFGDTDDLILDLRILSDDLTAIALALERRLGITLDEGDYGEIRTVLDLAKALHEVKTLEERTSRQ